MPLFLLESILSGNSLAMKIKYLFLILLANICFITLSAQESFTLSGYIKDQQTGETLPGANIFSLEEVYKGTTSNAYGFYSITLPSGTYRFVYSFLGYADQQFEIKLDKDLQLNVELSEGVELETVVVTAEEEDQNVQNTEMGTVDLPVENIKKLPALFGEIDVLKTIQLLPGVQSAGEGNAGFYVRGGGPDQNLVLLDEAVVYNSGHLLGFFSVFNADALKNTTLIKGGIPAHYGGRLSSVVDIQMKEGNDKYFASEGGIGLIASRLTFEGPIVKNRSSFIVSARRTYALDLAQPILDNTNFAGTNYYFYDLNAKVNYRFSDKDRIYLSGYFGRDVLNFRSNERDFFFNLPYGNGTATFRWNHLFNDKLFMNASVIYNDYDFGFDGGQSDFTIDVFSGVRDWNAKLDFDFFPAVNHKVKFGLNYTYHKLTPNVANATNGEVEFNNDLKPSYAHEGAAYIADDFKLSTRLSLNYGLRLSTFTQVGPYRSKLEDRIYTKGEPVKTYYGLEPRLSAKLSLDANSSLKAGVSVANQYLHLVSNSTSTLPTDVWVPSSEIIKPQRGIQYALGYFKNFSENKYESSVEIYYKSLENQIDYRENYVDNIAADLEEEFVFGTGESYGAELFFKKRKGRLNGWIGYTLSKTTRTFPDINEGETFPAIYDRRHDMSVVANYKLNDHWQLGSVFVFGTGNAYTPVERLFFIDQFPATDYGQRNSARLPDYHRLDISATYTKRPNSDRNFNSSWTFSIYNLYNRRNTFFTYYDFETDLAQGTAKATAYRVSLFPIIPSVTWNFSWQAKKD
jgi:hypothetical protein